VVYLHGIQSHGGWFERSCRELCRAGYEVFFLDRRGSGLNQPARGHARSWRQLVEDILVFLRMLRDPEAPVWGSPGFLKPDLNGSRYEKPILLLGVSWGGKLAAATFPEANALLDGLGLLYPGIGSRVRPHWYQALLLQAARRLGLGQHRVRIPLDSPTLFTGRPRWQRFIAGDPLRLHDATVGLLAASHDLDGRVPDLAGQIHVPTLMMLAGRDEVIDNASCRRFFEQLATRQKKLIEYPDARHTLEFEPDPEPFLRDLLDWVDGRSSGVRGRRSDPGGVRKSLGSLHGRVER